MEIRGADKPALKPGVAGAKASNDNQGNFSDEPLFGTRESVNGLDLNRDLAHNHTEPVGAAGNHTSNAGSQASATGTQAAMQEQAPKQQASNNVSASFAANTGVTNPPVKNGPAGAAATANPFAKPANPEEQVQALVNVSGIQPDGNGEVSLLDANKMIYGPLDQSKGMQNAKSLEEFSAVRQLTIKSIDENGNQKVSMQEMAGFLGKADQAGNKDGVGNWQEIATMTAPQAEAEVLKQAQAAGLSGEQMDKLKTMLEKDEFSVSLGKNTQDVLDADSNPGNDMTDSLALLDNLSQVSKYVPEGENRQKATKMVLEMFTDTGNMPMPTGYDALQNQLLIERTYADTVKPQDDTGMAEYKLNNQAAVLDLDNKNWKEAMVSDAGNTLETQDIFLKDPNSYNIKPGEAETVPFIQETEKNIDSALKSPQGQQAIQGLAAAMGNPALYKDAQVFQQATQPLYNQLANAIGVPDIKLTVQSGFGPGGPGHNGSYSPQQNSLTLYSGSIHATANGMAAMKAAELGIPQGTPEYQKLVQQQVVSQIVNVTAHELFHARQDRMTEEQKANPQEGVNGKRVEDYIVADGTTHNAQISMAMVGDPSHYKLNPWENDAFIIGDHAGATVASLLPGIEFPQAPQQPLIMAANQASQGN